MIVLLQFLDVKKDATPSQPTPSAASQVPSALPYPVYVQGMPVPYGASATTPYPSYVPPPLPQGYNPYGTMPYPSKYLFDFSSGQCKSEYFYKNVKLVVSNLSSKS